MDGEIDLWCNKNPITDSWYFIQPGRGTFGFCLVDKERKIDSSMTSGIKGLPGFKWKESECL